MAFKTSVKNTYALFFVLLTHRVIGSSDLVCPAGFDYYEVTGICRKCPFDFVKKLPGLHPCTQCQPGYIANTSSNHCFCDIKRNHVMDENTGLCGCIAGYEYFEDTGFCRKCPLNFIKAEPGSHRCIPCTPGFLSESGITCKESTQRYLFKPKSICPSNPHKNTINEICVFYDNEVFLQRINVREQAIKYALPNKCSYKYVIRKNPDAANAVTLYRSDRLTYNFYGVFTIELVTSPIFLADDSLSNRIRPGDELIVCDTENVDNVCDTECYNVSQTWDRYEKTCGCIAGYEYNNTTKNCQQCPQNFSKIASGAESCIEGCPPDFEYNAIKSICEPCRLGFAKDFFGLGACRCEGVHVFDINSNTCGCRSHFELNNQTGLCTACPLGFSKIEDGSHSCLCNRDNHVFNINLQSCGCIAGYSFDEETGICAKCPAGFFKIDSGLNYCSACDAGFYSAQTGATVCQKCNNNSIAVGGLYCTVCDSDTNKTVPNIQNTKCVCKTEYFFDVTNQECKLCPEGTIKSEAGDEMCKSCNFMESNIITTFESRMLCGCNPGFQVNMTLSNEIDRNCELCMDGTYNDVVSLTGCKICPTYSTSLPGSTNFQDCNICFPGYFLNATLQCEMCPRNSANSEYGGLSLQSCLPCQYSHFQPSKGQTACVRQLVELNIDPNDHVVGLFVDGNTSCIEFKKQFFDTTDRICWGFLNERKNPILLETVSVNSTNTYTAFEQNVLPSLNAICGDGILFPLLEECDDGNSNIGDGCDTLCKIEIGFGCEVLTVTKDLFKSLWNPSVCCRMLDGTFLQTGKCTSCFDRLPPYLGVRYNPRSCELQDVDECNSVLTNDCFYNSKLCLNLDALSMPRQTHKCFCASPLSEQCTDLDVDHVSYTVRGAIAVITANVSATLQHISQATVTLVLQIPLTSSPLIKIYELIPTIHSNNLFSTTNTTKSYFELVFVCKSWQDMNLLAFHMNLTTLGELLLHK